MKATALSPAARHVLATGLVIDAAARTVAIPGRLDRKLYLEVNAALSALGGTWTRKLQAHLFPGDPTTALASVVGEGSFVDTKRELDQFFTPDPLAALIAERADVAGRFVLEPSAGHGALAKAALAQGAAHVVCVDKDPACCAVLGQLGAQVDVCEDDFLALRPAGLFSRILMNPPFSGQQDIDHVTHAHALLPKGGRLVAVMANGVTFREDRKAKGFRALADRHGTIEELPPQSFRASGTDVHTVLVTLEAA